MKKILISNAFLGGLTGSETWVYSMKLELEKLGNQVTTWIPGQEIVETPDLAIINHNICLKKLKELPCKKIFTSHGVIPDLEQPIDGADIYVAVSEEVAQNLKNKGFDSVIIRNGIDCNKFKSTRETNNELKNVLFSSNYLSSAEEKIKEACRELGLNFRKIGGANRTGDVVEAINEADLVVGLGRTAYEAMACERNVIIYDYNGGDGLCTPENLLEFRKSNCSGRRYQHFYSVDELKNEMLKYDKSLGSKLRNYILENNNMEIVAQKYLSL